MRVLALSCLLLIGAVCAPAMAQTAKLDEKQKAVVVFDIQLNKIRNCELGKSLDVAGMLDQLPNQGDGPDPTKIDRVFGAMSAPEDLAAAGSIQMGKMPMEFFVRVKFTDAEAADDMMDQAKTDNGGTIERDSKTYYKPPNGPGAPEGLLMHQVDPTTIEMGTEAYVFHTDRLMLTDNLKSAWAKKPENDAIRIAMDLEGAKGLIAEAVAQGSAQAPPMVGEYLGLIDNMKDLRISLDFAGDNLLTLNATGVNEEDAEELKSGLDSLLATAKLMGQSQMDMLRQMDEDAATVANKFLTSLKATQTGNDVNVVIPKPEGFDAAVQKAVKAGTGGN